MWELVAPLSASGRLFLIQRWGAEAQLSGMKEGHGAHTGAGSSMQPPGVVNTLK